jgi:hypothetical protein
VPDPDACFFHEHPSDEQPPMAMGGVLLAAHDGDAMLADAGQQALDSRAKVRGPRHPPVEDVPSGVVTVLVVGSSTEIAPEEDVAATSFLQPVRELIAVCPLSVAGVRPGAYVGDHLHARSLQEPCEALCRVARMSYGQQVGHGFTALR